MYPTTKNGYTNCAIALFGYDFKNVSPACTFFAASAAGTARNAAKAFSSFLSAGCGNSSSEFSAFVGEVSRPGLLLALLAPDAAPALALCARIASHALSASVAPARKKTIIRPVCNFMNPPYYEITSIFVFNFLQLALQEQALTLRVFTHPVHAHAQSPRPAPAASPQSARIPGRCDKRVRLSSRRSLPVPPAPAPRSLANPKPAPSF